MSSRRRNNQSTIDLPAILFFAAVGVLCFCAGFIFRGNELFGSQTQGLPIRDLDLSEDGLSLTFYINADQWQATLNKPMRRPPNIGLASSMFIDGDRLLFVNADSHDVFFGDEVKYTDTLQILTG